MRVRQMPGAVSGHVRRLCLRHRTIAAVAGGVLAIVPAGAAVVGAGSWAATASTIHTDNVALVGGYDPKNPLVQLQPHGFEHRSHHAVHGQYLLRTAFGP